MGFTKYVSITAMCFVLQKHSQVFRAKLISNDLMHTNSPDSSHRKTTILHCLITEIVPR